MNLAIYTKSNRYGIDPLKLKEFYIKIKNNVIEIDYKGVKYLSDGYTLYYKNDFIDMLEGKIFPFPEHVTLKISKDYKINSNEELVKKIDDLLARPKINNIFD